MDENTLTDLKQFITATVVQNTQGIKDEIISEIKGEIKTEIIKVQQQNDDLDTKVDTIANTIGIQLEDDKNSVSEKLDDHEGRITRLEQKPA